MPVKGSAACNALPGRIDPDETLGSVTKAVAAASLANTKSAASPIQRRRSSRQWQAFVLGGLRGWSIESHWHHHGGVRAAVEHMLLVAARLSTMHHHTACSAVTAKTRGSSCGGGTDSDGSGGCGCQAGCPATVLLPRELWLLVLRFVSRRHWQVPAVSKPPKLVGAVRPPRRGVKP
jgi:hypothetical protein